MRVAINVLQGWLSRHHARHGWRVPGLESEDYIQQGLLRYLQIERKYEAKGVAEPQHFMSLFKTTWNNDVHDMSSKESRWLASAHSSIAIDVDEAERLTERIPDPGGVDVEELDWRLGFMSTDARALVTLMCTPIEALGKLQGIVLASQPVRFISKKLGWAPMRVRLACVEILEEFSMSSNPVQILQAATGSKQKEGEARQAYLVRLMQAVYDIQEEAWEKVPADTQSWFNDQVQRMNNGETINEPADEQPVAQLSDARRARKAAADAKKNGHASNGAAAAPAATAAAATEPATEGELTTPAAADPAKKISATHRARMIMLMDFTITPKDVLDKLKDEGYPAPAMSAIQAMRSDIRACLRHLASVGAIVDPTKHNIPAA